MDYAIYSRLSESNKARLREIDQQIVELQRERAKILRNKNRVFDDERDYLATKIEDFYVDGGNKMGRNVRINPKYSALWTGIRQRSEFEVFGVGKLPDKATDDQIEQVKRRIVETIDLLDRASLLEGPLW